MSKLKGVLVMKVFVGNLPPSKAQAFVERYKEQYAYEFERIRDTGYDILFVPTRSQDTSIEKIEL